MSFCGIASFGMINIRKALGLAVVSTLTLALSATTISLSTPAHAVDSASASTDVTLNLGAAISVRVLDSTGSQEISLLSFDLTPTSTGVTSTKTAVVDVSTSNVTGYKLYVEANGKDHNNNYTTDLVQADQDDSHVIPTSTTTTENKNFWNYVNPSLGSTSVIPAHGTPDKINQEFTPTDSTKTNIAVNIGVDTNITAGTYQNQLLFTAIANPPATDYSLYFEPGTTDTVTGLPDTMTASEIASQHTFTIPSTAPSRTGYSFTGYLDESTSTTYQAGDSITVVGDIDYTGSATLTAQWEQAGCTLGANRICYYSNEPSGTVSGTMEDQTIVYMTSSTSANTVDTNTLSGSTPELTLYSPNWTLSGYGFKGWNTAADGSGTMYGPNQTITLTDTQKTQLGTSGLPLYAQWVASEDSNNDGVADSMAGWTGCSSLSQGSVTALTYGSDTYAVAKLADGKCWMIENLRTSTNAGTATTSMSTSSYTSREYNLTNVSGTAGAYPINLTSPAASSSTSNQYSWKSYGGYYSWASAIYSSTAHTTQYGNPDSATGSTQGICPTGWRLPRAYYNSSTSGTQADSTYLSTQLGGSGATLSNNWRTYPNNFVFAGYWYGSSSYYRGTSGYYWSSTVYGRDSAYSLSFNSTTVVPAGGLSKRGGLSVRCMVGS